MGWGEGGWAEIHENNHHEVFWLQSPQVLAVLYHRRWPELSLDGFLLPSASPRRSPVQGGPGLICSGLKCGWANVPLLAPSIMEYFIKRRLLALK